jgi:3-hydroxymyristoyl/3-hydroxydecanoyl-(acyl carrier protein) dehydratase
MLPQAPPFRLVDCLLECDPAGRCVTLKRFSAGEWLLQGADTVPFSLVMEALCQGAAFLGAGQDTGPGRILRIDQAEMTGLVKAGDSLRITSTVLESGVTALKAESFGEVEGKRVARLVVLVGR